MDTVLVICTGNICRSPIAEALLRNAFPDRNVLSAGLDAVVGSPPDPLATRLMWERDIDISNHRGQQVATWMLRASDLVLVMEARQRGAVEALYPACRGKVFRMRDWEGKDIADPYGRGEMAMSVAVESIVEAVQHWCRRLNLVTSKFASGRPA